MNKYQRIKETIDSNGKSKFYPQHKFLCVWMNYEDCCGHVYKFDTYEEAKRWINYKPVAKTKIHEV